jgi:chromosome segregation ATPase
MALAEHPGGRVVQTLLDLARRLDDVEERLVRAETDRTSRLQVIEAQGIQLGEIQAERNQLRVAQETLESQLATVETDRAARLHVIETQGGQLGQLESDRNRLRAEHEALSRELSTVRADSVAQLRVIEAQDARLSALQEQMTILVEMQDQQTRVLMGQMRTLQQALQIVSSSGIYRALRRVGYWRFLERVLVRPPMDSSS